MNALTPLGMVSDFPSENQTNAFFETGSGAGTEDSKGLFRGA